MFESVTVDEALARGKRMVNYPVFVILFLPPAAIIYFFILFHFNGWIATGIVVLSFISAWLYWSFAIPKWRLWAFKNVRNVHELYNRAIKEQLIWPDGSLFNKTEIWSAGQREQWALLQEKFDVEDIFDDDAAIPAQIEIYYSKFNSAGAVAIGTLFFGVGLYLYSEDGYTWVSLLALVAGPGTAIFGFLNLRNRTPQIILSNDGVKLATTQFYNWIDVEGEHTQAASGNKGTGNYFTFATLDGIKNINLAELDISRTKLDTLLRVYRGRSNKKFAGKARFNSGNNG